MYKNRKSAPLVIFPRGKEADLHFKRGCANSLIEVRTGFGLS